MAVSLKLSIFAIWVTNLLEKIRVYWVVFEEAHFTLVSTLTFTIFSDIFWLYKWSVESALFQRYSDLKRTKQVCGLNTKSKKAAEELCAHWTNIHFFLLYLDELVLILTLSKVIVSAMFHKFDRSRI